MNFLNILSAVLGDGCDELIARDKVNLDIFWLRDEPLEDSANLPSPDVLALEIVEDLKAALSQLESIEEDLSTEEYQTTSMTRLDDGISTQIYIVPHSAARRAASVWIIYFTFYLNPSLQTYRKSKVTIVRQAVVKDIQGEY